MPEKQIQSVHEFKSHPHEEGQDKKLFQQIPPFKGEEMDLTSIEQALSRIADALESVVDELRDVNKNLDNIDTRIDAVCDKIDSNCNDYSGELEGIKDEISDMSSNSVEKIGELDSTLESIQTAVEGIDCSKE